MSDTKSNDFWNLIKTGLADAAKSIAQQHEAFAQANSNALPGQQAHTMYNRDESKAVQQLLRAMSIPCRHGNSGCGSTGFIETRQTNDVTPARRDLCPLCLGRKRGIDTADALALLSRFVDILSGGELHDEAAPKALKEWNENAARLCADNLVALRRREALELEERRIYEGAQKQIDRVRAGLPLEPAGARK